MGEQSDLSRPALSTLVFADKYKQDEANKKITPLK